MFGNGSDSQATQLSQDQILPYYSTQLLALATETHLPQQ